MRFFFLRDFLKDTVYKNNPLIIVGKSEISAVVICVNEENLAEDLGNFRRQLEMVIDADGAHIENVFA
jgi:hypothetical protein